MSAHTPGPWRRCSTGASGKDLAIAADNVVVANVVGFGYPLGKGFAPESDANARLIAAAPELLEALRELTASHSPETYDAARAAIAKAEGRPWSDLPTAAYVAEELMRRAALLLDRLGGPNKKALAASLREGADRLQGK